MKKFLLAAVLLVLSLGSVRVWAQGTPHRVVFAMTSPNKQDWGMTVANIRHLREGLAPDPVEIEVVAYGPGVVMVKKDSSVATEIQALEKDGVVFVACQNAMRFMHLTKDDLAPGVGVVPAGIVEVVKKEEAGWTYIKAGQ